MSLMVAAAMAIVDLVEPVVVDGKSRSSRAVISSMRRREELCVKGVMHLSECGITSLPHTYVLPPSDRPASSPADGRSSRKVKLPVVDMARLRAPGQRAAVLDTLDAACREYGFFQVQLLIWPYI